MPGVTEQEIAQAKQMNLYQYMQLCEPDNFKPEGPGQFRHKGHSSLTFAEDGSWTYFKTKATGRTALNYLIAVEGVSFVEAVREINRIQGGVRPSFQPVKAPSPPAEKKPAKEFRLPKPDKNNYAATAYLRKRCIHPNVLTVCKQKKILYQTSFKDHPNCVFVGRDGNGEPKGGSLRGCSQIQFRRDIPGSKKIYPFYIEAAANADTVEVYEAPIDAMSGASLKIMQHTGNWRGVHYLALGGTDYAALDAFLTYYPNITHIVLCLDNDEAGRTRTQDIIKHLEGNGKTVEDRPPTIGKDYNDTLVQVTQEYQKGRTSDSIAADAGDSVKQVYRYIRLNELIPELQKKVDSNTLKFNPAVELSYLTPDEQQNFLDYAEAQDCTPSLSQAQKLKAASKEGTLTPDKLEEIMSAQKPSVAPREPVLNINVSKVAQYFPTGCTKQQMENRILKILESYFRQMAHEKAHEEER